MFIYWLYYLLAVYTHIGNAIQTFVAVCMRLSCLYSYRSFNTLIERVHAMLHTSALPKNLWGEAIMHATWLKNCSSTRHLGTKTPYETLYLKKPNLLNILVWGCCVKVHDNSGSKLDMRAHDRQWVGFNLDGNGHCTYVTNRFSNLWAIIHPPLSTEQGVQHVRHVRQCASGSIKVL